MWEHSNQQTEEANRAAAEGRLVIGKTVHDVRAISSTIGDANASLSVLGEQNRQIGISVGSTRILPSRLTTWRSTPPLKPLEPAKWAAVLR